MLLHILCESDLIIFLILLIKKKETQGADKLISFQCEPSLRVQVLTLLYHGLHGAMLSSVHLPSAVTVFTAGECKTIRTQLGGQICE